MARQLIESLSSDFEPEKYHDEYREQVLELIERKAQGEEIVDRSRAREEPDEGARPDGGARGEPRRARRAASKAKAASQEAQGAGQEEGSRARR